MHGFSMDAFELALGGTLWIAAVYALMSVGTVVIFRTTRVLNFAGGDIGLLGAYLVATMVGVLSSFWLGLALGVILSAILGLCVYVVFMIPLTGRSNATGIVGPLAMVMSTFVLGILIENFVPLIWHNTSKPIMNPFSFVLAFRIGTFGMTSLQCATVGCAIAGIGGFAIFVKWTRLGRSMRAVANHPVLAARVGVNVHFVCAFSWAVGAVFSMLGALSYALSSDLDPSTTASLGLAIFPAIIIAGLDSIVGTLLGALVLAMVQTLVGLTISGTWTDVSSYVVLLVILAVRPYGIFGTRAVSRV